MHLFPCLYRVFVVLVIVLCVPNLFGQDDSSPQIIGSFPITYVPSRPLTQLIPDPDTIQWENVQSRPGYRYRGMLPLHERFHTVIQAKRAAGEPLTEAEIDTIKLLQSVRRWPEAPVPGPEVRAFMRYLRNLPSSDLNIAQSLMLARIIHAGLYPVDRSGNSGADRLVKHVQQGPFHPRNLFEWCFGRVDPWLDYQYATWGYDMRPPGAAPGNVFPASPFNGMQISYNLSGAALGHLEDKEGFTTRRSLKGILTGDELHLSGTASIGSGFGAAVTVRLYAGSEQSVYTNYVNSVGTCTFGLSIPRPRTAKSGGFRIDMVGDYSLAGAGSAMTTRGLVVGGNLEQSPEERSADDAAARRAWDAEVARTLQELGYEETPEGKRLKEMRDALALGDQGWQDYVDRNLKALGYESVPEDKAFNDLRQALVAGGQAWSEYVKATSQAASADEAVADQASATNPAEIQAMLDQKAWNFGSTVQLRLTTPARVAPGDRIAVEYEGVPVASQKMAWLGLFLRFDDNRNAIKYAILPVLEDHVFEMAAPDTPGEYEVRLFFDDTYQEVAASASITVERARNGL